MKYMPVSSSNAKEVQKIVDRTGAQIANLCTFLPQEKVGEFSGFDAVQLLNETEKAVGGPNQHADHRQLVALQAEMGDTQRQLDAKKKKVEDLEAQNASLERDREKMQEREAHLKKVDLCKKRLLWLDFEEIQEEARALKTQKEALELALRDAQGNLNPLKEQQRAAAALVTQHGKKTDARQPS